MTPTVARRQIDLYRTLLGAAASRPSFLAVVLIVAIAAGSTPLVQAMGLLGLVVLLVAIATIEVVVLVGGLMTTRPLAVDYLQLVPRRLVWAGPIVATRYGVFLIVTLGIGNTFNRLPVIGGQAMAGVGVLIGFVVSAAILGRMVLATSLVVAREENSWAAIRNSWRATRGSWPQMALLGLAILLLTILYTSALQTIDPVSAALTTGIVATVAACLQAGTYRAIFT